MLCKNCGKENGNTRFCIFCGADLEQPPEAVSVQPVMSEQPPMVYEQPQVQVAYEQPPLVYTQPEEPVRPKRKKIGLIIGLAAAVVLIGVAAVLFFTMTHPVEGQWFNEERGEVLVFGAEGAVEVISLAGSQGDSFTYDRLAGEGSFSIGKDSYVFDADDKEMVIDDLGTYVKADEEFDSDSFLDEFGKLETWYSEERGEVLIFNPEGAAQRIYLTGAQDTGYEFDHQDGSGQVTIGDKGYNFTIKNEQMNIADIGTYTKAGRDFISGDFINEHGKLGTWYCEDRAEVLVFNMDGTIQSQHSGTVNDASFEFNREDSTVKITVGPFTYEGEIKDGQLVTEDMGTFVQAADSFDTTVFFQNFDESILGLWYDPKGELIIDLRDDGTYEAISHGTTYKGTYSDRSNGAEIQFAFLDMEVKFPYTIISGDLVKDEESMSGPANTLVRKASDQLGEDQIYEKVIGTWVTSDGAVTIKFVDESKVVLTTEGYDFTGTYDYDPLGDVGLIHVLDTDLLFLTPDNDVLAFVDAVLHRK